MALNFFYVVISAFLVELIKMKFFKLSSIVSRPAAKQSEKKVQQEEA